MEEIALVRHLEELAANAWPAALVQVVSGWRLRYTYGVSRRANSVWPNEDTGYQTLAARMAAVEAFYRRWQAPMRYQICPATQPAHLDRILEEGGFRLDAPTAVQTATVADVLGRTAPQPQGRVWLEEQLSPAWMAAYRATEPLSEQATAVRTAIYQRIAPPTCFARLVLDEETVAVGVGVLERGWLGVFSMATRPDRRRQGAAQAILHALATWAAGRQATGIYLQVMTGNRPAQALYARSGFVTLYHYHYRERSPAP